MKSFFLFRTSRQRFYLTAFFLLVCSMSCLSIVWRTGLTQKAALSFSDIIYVLRSKKASLSYRNDLLITAVKERGIDFTLIEEFENELRKNGAVPELIEAIRQKSPKPQIISTPQPVVMASTPASTPDAAFYRKRGDEYTGRGEYEQAILEYDQAIRFDPQEALAYYRRGIAYHYKNNLERAFENYNTAIELKSELALEPMMRCVLYNPAKKDNTDETIQECGKTIGSAPDFALAYYVRGTAFRNQKEYDRAIADYNKFIELNPQNALAYINRADAYRGKENYDYAFADYNKAIELDPGNETAKRNLQRLQAERLNIMANKQGSTISAGKVNPPSPVLPIGALNGHAIKLEMPVYPPDAKRLHLEDRITVQITIDENGKVVSAKADSGHRLLRGSAEIAARLSKFKPITVNNQTVKATGFIVYNFNLP